MKKIDIILLALLGMMAFTWMSCSDSVDYDPAQVQTGSGLYFSNSESSSVVLENESGSFSVNVYRYIAEGTASESVQTELSENATGIFTVPTTVSFEDGSNVAQLTVNYSGAKRGTTYKLQCTVADDNRSNYGLGTQTFSINFPELETGNWEVVSKDAVLIENIFSMYGVKNLSISKVMVEKNKDADQYRFRSPYDNSYFSYVYGEAIFGDDFVPPYIVLDGEKYKKEAPGKYFIASMSLGYLMVDGEGPKADNETKNFGSVAGNLSTAEGPIPPTSTSYPLGTYTESNKMFDLGMVYTELGGYGIYPIPSKFLLYLDPKLMAVDYDRDYTWAPLYAADGLFTSEVYEGESFVQGVDYCAEDPTFFRMTNVYSLEEKCHLYFRIDENNNVTLPKGQKSGLTTYGNDIYMKATPGKSEFNPETGLLTLGVTFYLADKDGNETAELMTFVEKFTWGQGAYDGLLRNQKLSAYAGEWNVPFANGEETIAMPVSTFPHKFEGGPEVLLVQNLSGLASEEYDDMIMFEQEPTTGFLMFYFQQSGDFAVSEDVAYPTYVSPFYSEKFGIDTSGEEILLGGLTENGNLTFMSSAHNQSVYDGILYMVNTPEGLGLLSGYWAGLDWSAITKVRSITLKPDMSCVFAPFKKGMAKARRSYKKELKLQPVSSSVKANRSLTASPETATATSFFAQ